MKQYKATEKKMLMVELTENLYFTIAEGLDNPKWKSYDIYLHRTGWGSPAFVYGAMSYHQQTGEKTPIETVAEEVYNLFTGTDYAVPFLEDLKETYEDEYEVFGTYFDGLYENGVTVEENNNEED